jgi:pimeloyl-ACP methyl ester carboxylesterase
MARAPRHRTIPLADGRRAHALTWPGRGVPFVFLHGLLDSAEGWTTMCRATDRRCVAVDLGGFGSSDLPAHPAFSAYAADVVAALDVLVPGRFVLVGHSLGGAVATAVTERLADRVAALVLLAPAGFGRIGLAEAVSIPGVRNVTHAMLPFALGNRHAVATAYRSVIANGLPPDEEIVARVVERHADLVAAAREATKAVVRGGLSKRAFHRRRVAYDGPVAVVWGDRDRLVPISHLAGVATAFPHVEAEVWPGMGHHPQCERPRELLALLERTAEAADARRAARGRPRDAAGRAA